MTTTRTEIDNTTIIKAPVPDKEIARISAWPEEVFITLDGRDNAYTPDAARQIAAKIVEAADLADRLEFAHPDNPDDLSMIEKS